MKLEKKVIYEAFPMLGQLSKVRLPVRASIDVATIVKKLTPAFEVLSGESDKLVKLYGKKQKGSGIQGIMAGTPEWEKYQADLKIMLEGKWDEDLSIKKVVLPEKITGTCNKCNHNMDVTFEIKPMILVPLLDVFVELK